MEEDLWYLQQQSRVLQEFRENIQLLWDDEASKTINYHFLNPHQEDDDQMIENFVMQDQHLSESETLRTQAQAQSDVARELSMKIRVLIERAQEDIERAIQYYQQYRNFLAQGKGLIPEIEELVHLANATGEGAPPNEL